MTNKKLKEKIKDSFTNSTLPEFETIFKNCQEKKGMIVVEKKKRNVFPYYITAALVLIIVGLFSFNYYTVNKKLDTKISIDVNPSIELKINKKNKVLDVTAKNEDAKIIIDNMNLKGSDLDIAMNALLGSMLKHGYITDAANSILISVENKNADKSEEIRTQLVNNVTQYLNSNTIDPAILSQTVTEEDQYKELSEQYHISTGKVKLIQDILSNNTTYEFEDLVNLSINDLNLIFESQMKSVKVEGTPSEKAYIGEEKAKQIALNHANIKTDAIKVELEYDKIVVYEVEFTYNKVEYEYEINAINGEIVNKKVDKDENSTPTISTNKITKEKAKQIALNHANVKEGNITKLKIDFDKDENSYDIEFVYNNQEYEYDIHAETGKIIKSKIEKPKSENYITEEKAKQIAFNHANVTEENIKNLKIDFDKEDRTYDIQFIYEKQEYEYKIDGISQKIIDHKIEKNS